MNISLPPAWISDAACASVDPELWFPYPEAGHNTAHAARAICATCPALAQCADYAIARPELEGVWGGLSRRERARIRTQQRRELEWAA